MKSLDKNKLDNYKRSFDKGVAYYLVAQKEDGSFLDIEANKTRKTYLCQPYNCFALLYFAGAHTAAQKYREWFSKNLIDERDGLQIVDNNSVWATHTTYFKGWCVYGAHLFNFYEQSLKVVSGLDRFIDYESGGVYLTEKGAIRRTVTSFTRGAPIAMAMLATGRMHEAHKIGEYMLSVLRQQPEPKDKIYTYADAKTGKIITQAETYDPPIFDFMEDDKPSLAFDENEMDSLNFCLDSSRDYQAWALFGPPLNFLVGMYDYTADKRYLDGCMQIFEVYYRSRSHHSTRFVSSCKILQGLPQLYLKTGDERILTCIEELCDYLCEMQHPEGFWVKETLPDMERMITADEQSDWIRLVQIGDCALSLSNIIKHLG